MTNYAPNYTARLKVKYRTLAREHVCTLRLPRGTPTQGVIQDQGGAFLRLQAAMAPSMYSDFTIISMEFCQSDTDIWEPIPFGAYDAGVLNGTNVSKQLRDTSLTISGRGGLGGRGRFVMYGVSFAIGSGQVGDDTVITPAESPAFNSLYQILVAEGLMASDGTMATWHPKGIYHRNYKWERASRRGQ